PWRRHPRDTPVPALHAYGTHAHGSPCDGQGKAGLCRLSGRGYFRTAAQGRDGDQSRQRDQIKQQATLYVGGGVFEDDVVGAGGYDEAAEDGVSVVNVRFLAIDRRGPAWVPDLAQDNHAGR